MTFEELYRKHFESQRKVGNSNALRYRRGETLSDVLREADVPTDRVGVYIVRPPRGGLKSTLYIGHAGSWNRKKGEFGKQKLRGRISAVQETRGKKKIRRQQFFNEAMVDNGWQYIVIEWSTHRGRGDRLFPAKIEADLLQAFFDDHGDLPSWNKSF